MSKMFKLMVLSLVLSFACPGVYAEEKVGVPLTAGELAFSLNMVNSIELSGGEVGPFLDIKSLLTSAYKDASGGKKGSADVEFTVPMAKNFLFFMQRAKLKGDDAAVFFDLSKKIVAAIKKVTKE